MIYFYIGDRQCGKSTRLLYEASKNPLGSVILSFNSTAARQLVQRAWDEMNIDIYAGTPEACKGKLSSKILIDEFFFMKDYESVWASILPALINGGDIYIFSSFKDPIRDMKFINRITGPKNVISLTKNYRLQNYLLPHEGVTKEFKIPQIVMDQFVSSLI